MRSKDGGLRAVPGDVAEVWQHGRKVGVVFRWTLTGFDGAWKASAVKSRFEPDFDGDEVELRFFITSKSSEAVSFIGRGHVLNPVCEGEIRYSEVSIVGTSLRLETARV